MRGCLARRRPLQLRWRFALRLRQREKSALFPLTKPQGETLGKNRFSVTKNKTLLELRWRVIPAQTASQSSVIFTNLCAAMRGLMLVKLPVPIGEDQAPCPKASIFEDNQER